MTTCPREADDGVHIMTIHAAKGLEFPIVIVADAGNVGRAESSSTPHSLSKEYELAFNIPGPRCQRAPLATPQPVLQHGKTGRESP